jgi:uncharacterized protein (DUF58 family)
VVFLEHREYRPGDDPRLLDWRAYARSDRHTIKRFEQETQLAVTLVLDDSPSMDFGAGTTKLECARTLLAALSLLVTEHGDAAGVCRVTDRVEGRVPPRARPGQRERILRELVASAAADRRTNLHVALTEVAERVQRRGLVVVTSDLLDLSEDGELSRGATSPLDRLVHHGNDVWVFQILSPEELDFPLRGPTRFVGTEGEPELEVDADQARAGYLAHLERFLLGCKARVTAAGARYRLVRTDERLEQVLAGFLHGRSR